MTPFRGSAEGSDEAKYNTIHAQCRNVVERLNGVLKKRFRCLLGARSLHYSPEKATSIVNVCCALHNICVKFKVQHETEELVEAVQDDSGNLIEQSTNNIDDEAKRIRRNIMRSLVG